jgi:cytochrome P450
MADGAQGLHDAARERAWSTPLEAFQVENLDLYVTDTWRPWFERLRAEDPVHYTAESEFGPYWSVTRHRDIIAVDGDHATFSSSSELGGVSILESLQPNDTASFIELDPPRHDAQRKVLAPLFTTDAIAGFAPLIRERAAAILDELPIGKTFDFVDKVSIELTSQMLATMFDFPFEHRRMLPRASDLLLTVPGPGQIVETEEQKMGEMFATFAQFKALWDDRKGGTRRDDLISLLANDPATTGDDPFKYMGNVILMTVAGSDTTRHSISGAALAFHQNPDAYDRLRADPSLLETAVPEIIRWQTPVAHMRRTALADKEVAGKAIKKGDKVVMWYVSGNRDDEVIEEADSFVIDRPRPRQHVAFGFGIHRCLGNRLAEMQLKTVWEEMLKRFKRIELVGEPTRLKSNFIRGFTAMPVRIEA